jgi:dTDP-glucose pyrophosphorylase
MEAYAEIGRDGWVLRTAEKEIISRTAAAGLYYFMKGSDFVAAALEMLAASSDGKEVFVCPVFNELIRKQKRVTSFPIRREQRIEMGTPDDLSRSRDWLLQQEINFTRGAAGQCG